MVELQLADVEGLQLGKHGFPDWAIGMGCHEDCMHLCCAAHLPMPRMLHLDPCAVLPDLHVAPDVLLARRLTSIVLPEALDCSDGGRAEPVRAGAPLHAFQQDLGQPFLGPLLPLPLPHVPQEAAIDAPGPVQRPCRWWSAAWGSDGSRGNRA